MKTTIILIILYQIIELVEKTTSDREQITNCIESLDCAPNVDLQLIKLIKENLSNNSDPCDNFWNYACGSWTAEPYNDHNDNFGAILNLYADQLIDLVREWKKQDNTNHDPGLNNLMAPIMKYYKACLLISKTYLQMGRYLPELLERELFGANFKWEFLLQQNSYIWQHFDWLTAVAFLRKYGLNDVFLHESVSFARLDSSRYIVQLRIPPNEINFQNKYEVLKLMQEFDLGLNSKEVLKLTEDVVEFDRELVDLYKKYDHVNKVHFVTLEDLQTLVPSLDWLNYFDNFLNFKLDLKTRIEISGDLKYFDDLTSLLNRKNKQLLGFYVLMRFCKYLWAIQPLTSDRECLLHTNVMFPLGVNYLFDRFLYENRLKDEQVLQEIFMNLKQEFWHHLLGNKFALTNQELEYLLEKLNVMELKIGNLPAQTSQINYYYSKVKLSPNNFYLNHLEMLKFRTLKQHEDLLENLNLPTYYVNDDISQLRSAPYFIHRRNILIIPMLFLQLPFYHPTQHPVLHYSLLGWIMAHELSHAFDSHGLSIDAWGNENLLGLQISLKMSYLSSLQCLQNNSPTVSLNERLADVNGLQLVWQSYSQQFSYARELCEDFSLSELFFLNFAQFFCGFLPRPIGHDRDDVRVKLAVANIEEFSKIFQCSKGAKENPKEKCKIWTI